MNFKPLLQYALMLLLTAVLLWVSMRSLEPEDGTSAGEFLSSIWKSADLFWLLTSAGVAFLSHIARSERWKLLLTPIGYKITSLQSFLSVMVGYFINLAIPRGGEVARCVNLYRISRTPAEISLGTVIAERLIDLIFLAGFLAISFFIEFDKLMYFFGNISLSDETTNTHVGSMGAWIAGGIAGIFVLLAWSSWFLWSYKRKKALRYLAKLRQMGEKIKEGLLSVRKIENKTLFIFYSIAIWGLYYLMSYCVMLAFAETSSLGIAAALSIFVIGGVAMAMPLPGGAGSYHVLVPAGLVMLYGLDQSKAIAFTVIFHGWQTAVLIVGGAISLMVSQFIRVKE